MQAQFTSLTITTGVLALLLSVHISTEHSCMATCPLASRTCRNHGHNEADLILIDSVRNNTARQNPYIEAWNDKKHRTNDNSNENTAYTTIQEPSILPLDKLKHSGGPVDRRATTMSSHVMSTLDRIANMKPYSLDIHTYTGTKRTAGQAAELDNSNLAHVRRCSHDLNQFERLLQQTATSSIVSDMTIDTQAMYLSDTYGRPESGVMMGNTMWLGAYSQCLELQLTNSVNDARRQIETQYCLVTAHAPDWNRADTYRAIKLGVCMPKSCSNFMLEDYFMDKVDAMAHHHLYNSPYESLKTTNIYCLPDVTSPIRQYSWSAIGFITVVSLFLALGVWATLMDYLTSDEHKGDVNQAVNIRTAKTILIEGFSITRNISKFFRMNQAPNKLQSQPDNNTTTYFLDCLTGIKCIGLLWIICSHSLLISPVPDKNIIQMDKLTQTLLANVYLTGHLVVDTFFAISGILASYLLFKSGQLSRMTGKSWLGLTIHRYWRLTPLYLLCYWYSKSMGHLMASGPFWDYTTSEASPRLNCIRESWSEAIFHMSDFKSPKEHCVPFAWFIANGIKFWLVTPIFVTLIAKSVRAGYKFTLSVIVANIVLVAVLAYNSNVDMVAVAEFRPESAENMLNNMDEVYTRPYSRIGAYLIGLLAGHILYSVETKQMVVRLSDNANRLLWSMAAVFFTALMFMMKFSSSFPMEHIRLIFGLSCALVRPLFALLTCWVVFAIAQGQAKWLNRFLSASIWKYLISLSYSGYLIQGEVMAQLFLTRETAVNITYSEIILRSIISIAVTIVVSFFISLLIEYPLHAIEELILPVDFKKSTHNKDKVQNGKTLDAPPVANSIKLSEPTKQPQTIVHSDLPDTQAKCKLA